MLSFIMYKVAYKLSMLNDAIPNVTLLSVVMPNVTLLSVIMQSVIMLCVVMLSVIMMSVMALKRHLQKSFIKPVKGFEEFYKTRK
jgi:hypothetical protein